MLTFTQFFGEDKALMLKVVVGGKTARKGSFVSNTSPLLQSSKLLWSSKLSQLSKLSQSSKSSQLSKPLQSSKSLQLFKAFQSSKSSQLSKALQSSNCLILSAAVLGKGDQALPGWLKLGTKTFAGDLAAHTIQGTLVTSISKENKRRQLKLIVEVCTIVKLKADCQRGRSRGIHRGDDI